MSSEHYRRLESMYLAAPINQFYEPKITISEGECTIEIPVSDKLHHAGGAVHGSVYFKMLDDAAYFAANSFDTGFFLVTTSFTTYLTRPVSSGKLRSVGRVVNKNRTQFIAEAVVYDSEDREIGRGSGIFVQSKMALEDAAGYNK
ncbi:PaaI family thioesterase [Myxococcota bacterium]|nr:PaaI family thioesterase [Myxococcota bacterium]